MRDTNMVAKAAGVVNRKGPARDPSPSSSGAQTLPLDTPDAAAEIKVLDGSVRKQPGGCWRRSSLLIRRDMGCLCVDWKHQFGSHRVVYRVDPQQHVVVVCSVGARKQGDAEDIYRRLESVVKTGGLAEQLASVLWNLLPSKK
ncbi:MAG TPA: type II toxin-antitoxin system RelE/ParE family toxin [Candidatus Acidoferrales bacterium]|nr:type II toxin-antitoxin system RelE/ParE family toxin [Candidatus Acidoferrales bacterium]